MNGGIWVGGAYSGASPWCGTVSSAKPGPVDFGLVEAQLSSYSRLLARYPLNGTTSGYGVVTFHGTNADINVFAVASDILSAATEIVIDAPRSSTVVINVDGTTVSLAMHAWTLPDGFLCGAGPVKLNDFCNQIVWNMPSVAALDISGVALQGSVLAPLATLTGSGAYLNGTVIVNRLASEGCEGMHPHYFNGCLCTEDARSPYACCRK